MIDTGLKDKVVLVTGANNPYGIGAATAKVFAAEGVIVFLASEQARWLTGQLLYVGGEHVMPL